MKKHFALSSSRRPRPSAATLGVACGAVVLMATGCGRTLTITQADYINTASQYGRASGAVTGEPLEVSIVCVHPADLQNELNGMLDPGQHITSDLWYRYRPQPGDKLDDEGHSRFRLPANQIFVLTDEKQVYGVRKGPYLRGAVVDKRKKVVVRFDFGGPLHDPKSAIYVFPKFTDVNGEVIPAEPVVFNPPGDYTDKLFVEIGVDQGRENHGQYIAQKTERKLGHDKG